VTHARPETIRHRRVGDAMQPQTPARPTRLSAELILLPVSIYKRQPIQKPTILAVQRYQFVKQSPSRLTRQRSGKNSAYTNRQRTPLVDEVTDKAELALAAASPDFSAARAASKPGLATSAASGRARYI